jgi:serine acetyltransferase
MLSNLIIATRNGTDIRPGAVIGRRFEVHTSYGIEVDNDVIIGDDCIINTGVCIGNKANSRGEGVPRIGNNVMLGLGAKILGGITVGDNVIIGANSVVSHDVPSSHLAIGIPARNKPLRVSSEPSPGGTRTEVAPEFTDDLVSNESVSIAVGMKVACDGLQCSVVAATFYKPHVMSSAAPCLSLLERENLNRAVTYHSSNFKLPPKYPSK